MSCREASRYACDSFVSLTQGNSVLRNSRQGNNDSAYPAARRRGTPVTLLINNNVSVSFTVSIRLAGFRLRFSEVVSSHEMRLGQILFPHGMDSSNQFQLLIVRQTTIPTGRLEFLIAREACFLYLLPIFLDRIKFRFRLNGTRVCICVSFHVY